MGRIKKGGGEERRDRTRKERGGVIRDRASDSDRQQEGKALRGTETEKKKRFERDRDRNKIKHDRDREPYYAYRLNFDHWRKLTTGSNLTTESTVERGGGSEGRRERWGG